MSFLGVGCQVLLTDQAGNKLAAVITGEDANGRNYVTVFNSCKGNRLHSAVTPCPFALKIEDKSAWETGEPFRIIQVTGTSPELADRVGRIVEEHQILTGQIAELDAKMKSNHDVVMQRMTAVVETFASAFQDDLGEAMVKALKTGIAQRVALPVAGA